MEAEITISNYRCFSAQKPAKFLVKDGETAIIGVNNSGKFTLLKFFFEFRELFRAIHPNSMALSAAMEGKRRAFAPQKYTSSIENIFHNRNDSDITIRFEVSQEAYAVAGGPFAYDRDRYALPRALIVTIHRPTNAWSAELISQTDEPYPGGGPADAPDVYQPPGSAQPVFLAHFYDAFDRFGRSMYIGPFRNALNLSGVPDYFDIQVGSIVISGWDAKKHGDEPQLWKKIQEATEVIRRIFGHSSLDINANHERNDFWVTIDGHRYPLSAIGAGFAQFLLIFANLAMKEPPFVLIDEPELNLHPALQAEFVRALRTFATNGVVFSTHCLGLARAAADRIYSVLRGGEGRSELYLYEKTPRLSELLGELGFTAYQELGFEKLLLVEGPTEVKAVQQILRMFRKDQKIVLVPLGGSSLITGGREHELEELKRITDSVYALIDSERTGASQQLRADRQAFIKSCATAKIVHHVTDRRATENYFTDAAVKRAKSEKYRALGPYERLEDAPSPKWGKAENWRIAGEMTADDWRANDIGQFLESL